MAALSRLTETLIRKKIRAGKYKAGYECVFVKIGKIGYKLFQYKDDRDYAYFAQRYASGVGVAPETGDRFNLLINSNVRYSNGENTDEYIKKAYGYSTEVVKVGLGELDELDYNELHILVDIANKNLWPRYKYRDAHDDNIFVLKNKIKFIDFGPISCKRL